MASSFVTATVYPNLKLCVQVEREVWKSSDIDVVPIPLFVVASEIGGQVLGAFDGSKLIGFTLAHRGMAQPQTFPSFSYDSSAGRIPGPRNWPTLKAFSEERCLARGIELIEWTFDPLVAKNAYFNFMRLGAIARRYLPNVYGITTSPLHASLPTDRLVAEWHLRSPRVLQILAKKQTLPPPSQKAVRITIPHAIEELKNLKPGCGHSSSDYYSRKISPNDFAKGYVATRVIQGHDGMDYILERGRPK